MKTLKDIEGQSEAGAVDYVIDVYDLRDVAREWIEYLGGIPSYVVNAEIELKKAMSEEDSDTKFMQIDTCLDIIARWQTENSNNAKMDFIVEFFNLEEVNSYG